MSNPVSLKSAERKAFQATFSDGLWDVFIGCFILMFAVAPFLSEFLGDFWSSAIFLPFWGLVYLAIYLVRKAQVAPRIGTVVLGKPRQKRLRRMTILLLIANSVIFLLGLAAFLFSNSLTGGIYTGLLGLFLMAGFSFAAYTLDYPRFYLYGVLLLAAPWVGEWLYREHGAVHHGFPVTFGFVAGLMILLGLVSFFRLVKNTPKAEIPGEA